MLDCPFPRYWMCHILVALLIALVVWPFLGLTAGLASGASFYIGREIRDYEKLGEWDWPGLIAPVSACLLIYMISTLF